MYINDKTKRELLDYGVAVVPTNISTDEYHCRYKEAFSKNSTVISNASSHGIVNGKRITIGYPEPILEPVVQLIPPVLKLVTEITGNSIDDFSAKYSLNHSEKIDPDTLKRLCQQKKLQQGQGQQHTKKFIRFNEHKDTGLFNIVLISSPNTQGLQFRYSDSGPYRELSDLDCPKDRSIAVIIMGADASKRTNNTIPSPWHRVVFNGSETALSRQSVVACIQANSQHTEDRKEWFKMFENLAKKNTVEPQGA